MKWIKENLGFLLSVLLITMTLAVFGPIELYFTNSDEFWFSLKDVLLISSILTVTFIALLAGIGTLLKGKARKIYSALIFVFGVLFYIQGNYANIDYGLLDGTAIKWDEYQLYGIVDTLGWVAFIVIIAMLFLKKHKLFVLVQKYASLFIVATQILSLIILILTSQDVTKEKTNYYLTTDGIYTLGKEDNIVVFILDAFDDEYFEEILKSEPEDTKEVFDNFVRFNNAAAGGANTKVALPTILTGEAFLGGESFVEYIQRTFNADNLYSELEKNDYDVRMYTSSDFVPPARENLVKNQVSSGYVPSSNIELTGKYFTLICYKYMPHILKPYFWFYSEEFEQYKMGNAGESYNIDDVKFYSDLEKSGLEAANFKNSLRIYHLKGAHPPYAMDEYAQAAQNPTQQQQNRGAIYIVNEYIQKMKELGLYDNATIIVMADHGREDPAHGVLLVKQKGSDRDYFESAAPVSYFDLHNTLFECIGKDTGDSFFDIQPGEERQRYFYFNSADKGKMAVIEYCIQGDMDESGSRVETGNVYKEPEKPTEKYEYGTVLTFGGEATSAQYTVSGVSTMHLEDYAWTDAKECIFRIPLKEVPSKNLMVSLNIMTTYSEVGAQRIHAYANGTLCMMESFDGGGVAEFVVPKDCLDPEDPVLELTLNLLDAVCPRDVFGEGHDERTLALALTGLSIVETDMTPDIELTEVPLDEKIIFAEGNAVAEKLFENGVGAFNEDYVWTIAKTANLLAGVNTEKDLSCEITLIAVFNKRQTVQIESNGVEIYADELDESTSKISFKIPKECFPNGVLMLKFNLKDAISPETLGTGADKRDLALALHTIQFSELKEAEQTS